MSINDSIMEVFLSNTLYFFCFDLLDGVIDHDIVDRNGKNITKELGLTAPFQFDELMHQYYSNVDIYGMQVVQSEMPGLCCAKLLEAYKAGTKMINISLYEPVKDKYYRIAIYLIEEENGRPQVYACCYDITAEEKTREQVYDELQSAKMEVEDIVASANIGIWHIYLPDGEKPRMTASTKMCEILGVKPGSLSEEELYDYWYSNIKKSSVPLVNETVTEIITKGIGEVTYSWNAPKYGEIYVRCGGSAIKTEQGYVLRGYHMDVTERVNYETKQNILLQEALDEVNRQKKLLQEALDNYKEADYDRRRDFLTGLRNRQDMFDLIQDSLSGKRDQISAMYMMDIDSFKQMNDHYGHLVGDDCLKRIGTALNEYGEENNIYFYRYGGEEILGISFGSGKTPAVVAEELLQLVRDLAIPRDDMPAGIVTISLGYTTNNSRYEKMIDKADTAMYKAKGHGKNQAVCYEEI